MLQNLLIIGPPGSGKGTLAKKIAENYSLEHISTGELIRREVKNNNPQILPYKEVMSKGGLLPDEVVLGLIKEQFEQKGSFILDGYPRNTEQAKLLDSFLHETNIVISSVLKLDLDDEIVRKRISGRRECTECSAIYNVYFSPSEKEGLCDKCNGKLYQRPDDTAETVENRLKVYHEQTSHVESYYEEKGLVHAINVSGTIDENYAKVKQFLDSL